MIRHREHTQNLRSGEGRVSIKSCWTRRDVPQSVARLESSLGRASDLGTSRASIRIVRVRTYRVIRATDGELYAILVRERGRRQELDDGGDARTRPKSPITTYS